MSKAAFFTTLSSSLPPVPAQRLTRHSQSEAAFFTTLSSSMPSVPAQQLTRHSQSEAGSSTSTTFARRGVVLISFLTFLRPDPAAAFSLGISGPKDWLKEQKRKASKFLLAPIVASRRSLQAAQFLLSGAAPSLESVDQLQQLVISASRDCVPSERNSFVAFQSQTGVEVCTFSLLVKNAASLLDTTNPVKLEAEAKLSDLVRSFSSLIAVAKNFDIQIASCKEQAENALMDTMLSLNKFEEAIQNCLI